MDNDDDKKLLRNNPVFIIGLACLVAIAMFLVGFLTYYHSDTKRTIEQIQENNNFLYKNSSAIDLDKDKLSPSTIDNLQSDISDKIESHDDDVDFSPDELTDSALGL